MPSTSRAKVQVEASLNTMKDIADVVNAKQLEIDARSRVAHIQATLFNHKINLIDPHRLYVRHGALKKKWNRPTFKYKNHKKYLFVLFNDVLIYASRPSATNDFCSLKKVIALRDARVEDLVDNSSTQYAWRVLNATKSIEIYASSLEEKQEWIRDLNRCILHARTISDEDVELRIGKPSSSDSPQRSSTTGSAVSKLVT